MGVFGCVLIVAVLEIGLLLFRSCCVVYLVSSMLGWSVCCMVAIGCCVGFGLVEGVFCFYM